MTVIIMLSQPFQLTLMMADFTNDGCVSSNLQ